MLGKTGDKTGDMNETRKESILTLLDFHSRRELPIYLPSSVETKKADHKFF